MNKLDEVIREASKLVLPNKEEEAKILNLTNLLMRKVKEEANKSSYKPEVLLQGSIAKGTWLKDELDIDIFLRFPPTLNREVFEKEGLGIGLRALSSYKPYLRYAEHPYVEAEVDTHKVNVVPCYKVEKGRWISAADRTPYHTDFIKRNLKEEQRLEVRLLKKFLKGIGTYGGEIQVQGFSGYVCEVLTLKFGSFLNTLNFLSNMREREIVSLNSIYEKFAELRFSSPLILIDPVDETRNLGEAIAYDKLAIAILSSRRILENPSLEFFLGKKIQDYEVIKELYSNLILLYFKHSKRSVDILWGQLRRSLKALKRQLEIKGFKSFRAGIASNNEDSSCFIFLLDSLNLSNYYLRTGPKVFSKEDCDRFLKKNNKNLLWIGDDGRLYSLIKRYKTHIIEVLSEIIESKQSGISKGIFDELRNSFKIIVSKDIENLKEDWIRNEVIKIAGKDKLFY
ncbi:MAG: CCA tRNA nucleotidyltransferase [Nitrososphaerales archaeon]